MTEKELFYYLSQTKDDEQSILIEEEEGVRFMRLTENAWKNFGKNTRKRII